MTKEELVQKLRDLPDDQFARLAPFLGADLEAVDELAALYREVDAGRRSATTEPVLEAADVYARARQVLSE